MKVRFLALCFLFSAATAVGWAKGEEVVILYGGGHNISRSANKVIEVKIEKHADNREVVLVCESADFYRSSGKSLNGKEERLVIAFALNLYPGDYECRATLYRKVDGKEKEFSDTTRFTIY